MATETERKFLLSDESWRSEISHSEHFRQGYLGNNSLNSVRVRISPDSAWMNIKAMKTGVSRDEFDYEIPRTDALYMLDSLCLRPLIEKTRHYVPVADHIWEIDEFEAENHGLLVAEIELGEENEAFTRPEWLGPEVTHDPRYYNVALVSLPFSRW